MTFAKFQAVADQYGLRRPEYDEDGAVCRRLKDQRGNIYVGQFKRGTHEKCGVIRKISADGDFLSDQVIFGKQSVGLVRLIDSHGHLVYFVRNKDGAVISSKFYDRYGQPSEPMDFKGVWH